MSSKPADKKADAKDAKKEPEQVVTEVAEEEQQEPLMGIDEFYPDGYVDKPITDTPISQRNKEFFQCFGVQSFKRFNLHYLENNVIVYATGNTYQIYNIDTHDKHIYLGKDTDGIGSISVHPSRKYFAVAEKGKYPNIYIYEYPSLRLYRILKKGTENAYAHCEFSSSGNMLASVGGSPDYTITVWDWISQRVVLKAKAFSQEVFRVSFSPFTDDTLFTSGSGHIRFWRMAQTFTGLKLQGEIGKFGALEISDVTGLQELPDGKIICGSEYGTLILWEGNLVKAHLVLDQATKKPLHDGPIEVVSLEGDTVLTAGGDGYIKWWKFQEIDNAEADEVIEVAITPIKEKLICDELNKQEPAYIVSMIKGHDHYLLMDGKGKVWKLMNDTMHVTEIMHYHSGKINDMVVSQVQNVAVTVGQDGQVKLWDFIRSKEHYSARFSGSATSADILSTSLANQGKVVAVGFDNGLVRILLQGPKNFEILKAFKAHDTPIIRVKYSPDQTMLVTCSQNGEVFFFQISGQEYLQKYEPLCMVQLDVQINDLRWDSNSSNVLIGCQNGYVYEITRPNPKDIDNTETFLTDNLKIRSWRIKMMEFQMKKNQQKDEVEEEKKRRMRLRGELPKEEDEPEEDWDPEPIFALQYLEDGTGRFMISSTGLFSGFYYICDFNNPRPLKAVEIYKTIMCKYFDTTENRKLLILGFENGEFQLRNAEAPEKYLSIKMHDASSGKITSVKFDMNNKFVLSTAEDGLMYTHKVDVDNIMLESTYVPVLDVEGLDFMPQDTVNELKAQNMREFFAANIPNFTQHDHDKDGLPTDFLEKTVKVTEEMNEDILDPTQYSIQQAKLRTEEDHRLKLAEEKKEQVKGNIRKLRKAFKELRVRNSLTEEWIQITEEDFNIDPLYFDMLQDRNSFKIEETRKEVAWGIEYHTVKLNKLKDKFYDTLEFEKFTVKAIQTTSFVTTFRVHKMSEFLQKNIELFKQMLETELQGKDNSMDFGDEDMDLDGTNDKTTNDQKAKDAAATKTSINNKTKQPLIQQKKTEAEKKREERKVEREERKRKIEKLEKKEAMHSGEDPADRKNIEIALQTYGDYKLKTSAAYIVPENQRVNFAKKRQQMVLLEGSIHKLKVDFNSKIQELKLRKREIIDKVKKQNSRLNEINSELGEQVDLFEPTIDETTEYPEKFFDVNDQDIETYRKNKREKEMAAAASKKTSMGPKKAQAASVEDPAQQVAQQSDLQKEAEAKIASDKAAEERKRFQGPERKGRKAQESDMDEEMKQIRRIELLYEREHIQSDIDSQITSNDTEIKEMQKEKYRLESDLKNAEMKLILFFEELILLKSMESKDQELTKRLAKCRQEKGQILREINEISKKLKEQKKNIDAIRADEEQLMIQFHEYCPEGSDKYEDIRKYFEKINKKHKHTKAKVVKDAGGDDDDDDDDVEEEPEEEGEDEDEEEENVIAGLPQEEYKIDDIERLKEKRNDLYYSKGKITDTINELENQRKRLENQEKRIKAELEDTEEEIQDFQKEKLAKLNQLDVSVVLKVKQIQNLEPDQNAVERWTNIREKEIEKKQIELQNNHDQDTEEQQRALLEEEDYRGYFIPKTLKDSILFTRTQLLQLINRKRELDEEQINLDQLFKQNKRDNNAMKKEIKELEKDRAEKEREYNERQMLRFGNLVDLDNLEISGPSNIVLKLQNDFAKMEKKCISNIEEADGDLEKTQRELTQSIKENTNLLNLIRELGEQQLELNRKLDSTNKAIFVDEDDEEKKNMMEEKQKLKKLLELQGKEIETLKTEINLYKKKGGHIYTKVTTNRRVANLNQNE